MPDELTDALVALIDDYSLLAVMEAAAEACRAKAAVYKDDKPLADRWRLAAKRIGGMRKVLAVVPAIKEPASDEVARVPLV